MTNKKVLFRLMASTLKVVTYYASQLRIPIDTNARSIKFTMTCDTRNIPTLCFPIPSVHISYKLTIVKLLIANILTQNVSICYVFFFIRFFYFLIMRLPKKSTLI